MKGVTGHKFSNVKEVYKTESLLQFLVEFLVASGNTHGFPELFTEFADFLDGLLQAGLVAGHANILPHDVAKLLVNAVHGFRALDGKNLCDALLDGFFGGVKLRGVNVCLGLCKLM